MASLPSGPSPIHPSFVERLDSDFIEYYNAYLGIKVSHKFYSV